MIPMPPVKSAPTGAAARPTGRGASRDAVLVVDPRAAQSPHRALLAAAGTFHVDTAGGAAAALALARTRPYRALVLDDTTPGWRLVLASLSSPAAPGTPAAPFACFVVGDDAVTGEGFTLLRRADADHRLLDALRAALSPRRPSPPPSPAVAAELAAVLAATSDGICGLDGDGTCAYANRAAGTLLRATDPADLVGLPLSHILTATPAPSLPPLGAPPQRWPAASIRRMDGTTFPAAAELHSVDAPNAHLAAVLTMRDATSARAREQRLAQANKMEAVGQLTGAINHDFNNLLTVVVGNLRLLLQGSHLALDDRELVEDALSAAYDGINLTRRLLSIARDRPLRPRAVDLRLTLRDFSRLIARVLGDDIQLLMDAGPVFVAAVVDRAQLESSILNLALNARHAMPTGGRLQIHVDAITLDADEDIPPGRYARVRVIDDGHGMDPETAERAIEPFFTTREATGGTGLGLSTAYAFARQSGGTLHIESAPGAGTTVTLLLPYVDHASPPTLVHPGPSARQRTSRSGAGARVLVVEDEERVRRFATRTLVGLGHTVVEARDADEAIDRLGREAIDVVFSDVRMPGPLDGYDLARWIRIHRPDLPVVLATGFDAAPHSDTGPPVDAELLRKPYHESDLARAIGAAIARA